MRPTPIVFSLVLAVGVLAAVFASDLESGQAGPAPTQTVTRFDDPSPPGLCQPGDCSLREAVLAANTQAGPQLIILEPGTYNLSIDGRLEDGAITGDIDIVANLSIVGAGMNDTTIDVNGADTHDRAFDIHKAAQAVITDMRITDGLLEGDDEMFQGGAAIRNSGLTVLERLLLDDSHVTGSNSGLNGGAIENRSESAMLELNDSVITGNTIGGGNGGGFANGAEMIVRRTTVDDNHVENNGGGVSNYGNLTLVESTISNNSAMYNGGGLLADFGDTAIVNSTISGNTSGDTGGGVYHGGDELTIRSSTIANNTASFGSFSTNAGGGVYNHHSTVLFANTILAGNKDTNDDDSDCAGSTDFPSPLTSEGYNLIQSAVGCPIDGDETGNVTFEDPVLGPLADNGGPTLTHALNSGSPATNAGNPAGCEDPDGDVLVVDQRGAPRPFGPECDIGAFERGATPPSTPSPTPSPSPTPDTETPTPTPQPTETPEPTGTPTKDGIQGDTDCDKDADSVDSLFVLREVAGLGNSKCIAQGDVDCDGDRDTVDALSIQRHVAALPPLVQQEPCADVGTPL